MDRDTIYLDNDDEITSVVDKLKGSDFTSIDLVIPKEALVLKSVVNLKLLKKQAESLGKEIVVVTQDKVGRKLAEQIGIPVIEKPGEQPKEVRMTEGENPQEAAKVAAAAAAASIATEEAIEFKKNAGAKAEEAEEADGIEFKQPASPIEPTAEVVGATAGAEAISEAAKAEAGSAGKPPKGGKKRFYQNWKFWTIAGFFGGLAILAAAYIFIPMVNIQITLAAQKKDLNFNFTADKSVTSVNTTTQTIPAQIITIEQSKNQQYPATGKKDAGTQASGTITITDNGYTTAPNPPTTLVAGTRFVNAGGSLVYKSTANVSVPVSSFSGGTIHPGAPVTVAVQADQPGDKYNIPATSFSTPGLSGDSSKMLAASSTAFTGGTTKQITYVTQTDVNSAKDDLSKQMETDLVAAVNKQAGTDTRLLDKAYKIEAESATASPDVNGEGANFTMTIKEKITAIVFKEADLTKLATSVLGDQIGSTKEIVDPSGLTSQAVFVSADFDKGTMQSSLTGTAYVASKLDQNAIKVQIAGESNAQAISDIQGMDGVESAQITRQFPSFLAKIPRIKSHIYLNSTLDKSGT